MSPTGHGHDQRQVACHCLRWHSVDIILLCVFYSLITSVQRASHGWSHWINAHFGSISESLQQSTFVDNQGKNRTGHQKSLSIFYRVNIDFLWLFIFITLSQGFYLFNSDVNGWTPKTLLIKVLSLFPYLKLPFCRVSLHFPWCIEQSYGLCGRGRGWEDLGEWHWNM